MRGWGGGDTGGIEGKLELALSLAFRCLFRKGGFLSGKTAQQRSNTPTPDKYLFFEAHDSYITHSLNSAPEDFSFEICDVHVLRKRKKMCQAHFSDSL